MEQKELQQMEELEDKKTENEILKTIFSGQSESTQFLPPEKNSLLASQWELSFYDVIEELEHILKGHIRDKDGFWQPPAAEKEAEFRLASDLFIHDVKIMLSGLVNKNTILSSLPEERVYFFIRTFRINLVILLAHKSKEYQIKREYRTYILDMIVDIVAAAFFRAMDGGEAKRRASTTINRYNYGELSGGRKQEKKGLLGIGFMGL